MRIIFFGTPDFAANNLQHLIEKEYNIVAIVTPPDSRKGRGKQLKECAVKKVGTKNKIPVLQPLKLKDKHFINELTSFNANLFVVVAFRMIPDIVWKIPSKGTINLHTSLLPNYRGAAPINWVLINGEKQTGISTFFINNEIDSGDIILQKRIELSNKTTAGQLHNILMNKGKLLLEDTLHLIQESKIRSIKQKITPGIKEAPKLSKDLLKINWNKSANKIHNLVRGLSPLIEKETILKDIAICPSAWFILEDENQKQKRVKIHLTKVIKNNYSNINHIETDNKSFLHIHAKKDLLSVLNLQMEGKKAMTIQQFLQGNKLTNQFKAL
ncbi:MAG: methionyl-tRNA formyltransferase [Flavobacteriales bacterium]|nr:methionyl-tRNA formyltransferase [Flavobacteriales bacterium]|tara:strand:+ start:8738 stop:9718 length:981 start_codon:yes stop_codon:yes gene_type:complete